MSKNLTRKGLAFGAIVALGSSLLAGAPANADNNGPITLLPDGGTVATATNNTIIGAGLTMTGTINPAKVAETPAAGIAESAMSNAGYIITNASAAKLTLTLTSSVQAGGDDGFLVYDADGNTSANGTDAATTLTTTDIGTVDTVAQYVIYDDSDVYVTNAKKIFVSAVVDGGDSSTQDLFSPILINAAGTSTVTVSVQALTDTEAAAADTTGKVGAFENASSVETVTLYPVSAVTATTSITTLARATDTFVGSVVYGSSINPFAVDAATYVNLFKDGKSYSLDENDTASSSDNLAKLPATTANATTGKIVYSGFSDDDDDSSPASVDFVSGVYSAQSYFKVGSDYIAVGAASAVVDLSNGAIAAVSSTDAYMTETANVDFASNTAAIRTGTNAVTVVAKTLTSGSAAIEKAGLKYKATVTAVKLAATSTVAISGSASTLAATDDVVVAYATSDSTGKASFTLTNAGAVKADNVTVAVSTLNNVGVWVSADSVDITWADAALTSFSAVPGNYISGENPTLTYKAKDQFGQPVSKTATGALSVTVVAKIGGIEKKLLLSDTKSMVDGSVAFTFANFATATIPGQVQATLFEGVTKSAVAAPAGTTAGVIVANVYNTSDTATITVLDSYATTITYKDFVVGDATDATVAAAVTLTGIDAVTGAAISGSVQNASAVGQPGAVVTIAADGVLFYDSVQGIYAEDSIVIYTNEYGTYAVEAIAQMINTAGHAVTITSGEKTVSSLLKAYLPEAELTAGNLALSWDLPAELVMNTTYALTVTLTDKWGNPVATPGANSVSIEGNGSVLVNGVVGATAKKFDKNGQTTVFVRSIKDIAGPGAVTATILDAADQYSIDPAVTPASGDSDGTDSFGSLVALTTDATSTVWDETAFASALSAVVDVKETATVAVSDTKVNVGSFKGYVALYAKGYAGQKMSAIVAGKWIVVASLATDFERVVRYTGAGYDIVTTIYIDGVKVETFSVTTK